MRKKSHYYFNIDYEYITKFPSAIVALHVPQFTLTLPPNLSQRCHEFSLSFPWRTPSPSEKNQ